MSLAPLLLVAALAPQRILSLPDALEQARHRPAQVKAKLTSDIGRARVGQALSPLLPQISGQAQYQRSTANFVARPGQVPNQLQQTGTSWDTRNFFSLSLTASQTIYDSQVSIDRYRAAQENALSAAAAEKVAIIATFLEVRTNYYVALAQRQLVKVAEETLALEDRRFKQVEGFVRVGTRPEIDLAQSRVTMANAKVSLTTATGNFEAARAQLNLSMGAFADTNFDVVDEPLRPVEDEDKGLDEMLKDAEEHRPDLYQLDKQIRFYELTLSSTKGNYGPSLSGSMGVTYQGRELDQMVWNWNAALTLQWSMFTGLSTFYAVKEAAANLYNARADRDQLKLQVQLDIARARIAVRTAKEALLGSREAHTAAREQLRLAEGRYSAGIGNIIELGDAQLALTSAAAQEVQAQLNLLTARAQLLAAMGRDS